MATTSEELKFIQWHLVGLNKILLCSAYCELQSSMIRNAIKEGAKRTISSAYTTAEIQMTNVVANT